MATSTCAWRRSPSQSGSQAHRFWPLHRVHAYDACPTASGPARIITIQLVTPASRCATNSQLQVMNRPQWKFTDPEDETEANTVSAVPKQILESTGWDFGLVYRFAAISVRVILKELKRRMEPERWKQVFPLVMMHTTIARKNATVAGLAQLCLHAYPRLLPCHVISRDWFLLKCYINSSVAPSRVSGVLAEDPLH